MYYSHNYNFFPNSNDAIVSIPAQSNPNTNRDRKYMLVKMGKPVNIDFVRIVRERPQSLAVQEPSQQRKYSFRLGAFFTIAAGYLWVDVFIKTNRQKQNALVFGWPFESG